MFANVELSACLFFYFFLHFCFAQTRHERRLLVHCLAQVAHDATTTKLLWELWDPKLDERVCIHLNEGAGISKRLASAISDPHPFAKRVNPLMRRALELRLCLGLPTNQPTNRFFCVWAWIALMMSGGCCVYRTWFGWDGGISYFR